MLWSSPLKQRAEATAREVKSRRMLLGKKRRRKVPRARQPKLIEREYKLAIIALVMPRVRRAYAPLLEALPSLLDRVAAERVRDRVDAGEAKTAREMIEAARAQLEAGLDLAALQELSERYAARTAAFQRDELERQTRAALGTDVFVPDNRLRTLLDAHNEANVGLIRDIGETVAAGIERATMQAVTTGTRHEVLAATIQNQFGLGERRSALIARDQVGKLYGQVAAARQREIGVGKFIWRTAGDERVRDEHEARDGNEYSYDDPPNGELPGEPILCRCYPEPVFDDILGGLDDESKKPEPEAPVPVPASAAPAPRLVPSPDVRVREEPARQSVPAVPSVRSGAIAEEFANRPFLAGLDLSGAPSTTAQASIRDAHDNIAARYGMPNQNAARPGRRELQVIDAASMPNLADHNMRTGTVRLNANSAATYEAAVKDLIAGRDYAKEAADLVQRAPTNFVAAAQLREVRARVEMIATMTHEAIHGHGPGAYAQGLGSFVEEVVTESAARRITNETLGIRAQWHFPDQAEGSPDGAYGSWIDGTRTTIQKAVASKLELSDDDAAQMIGDAALRYKSYSDNPFRDKAREADPEYDGARGSTNPRESLELLVHTLDIPGLLRDRGIRASDDEIREIQDRIYINLTEVAKK